MEEAILTLALGVLSLWGCSKLVVKEGSVFLFFSSLVIGIILTIFGVNMLIDQEEVKQIDPEKEYWRNYER